jgi:hypothetical protein
MKPLATSTYGRNHYFRGPKEHRIPKSAKCRRGQRTGARQIANAAVRVEVQHAGL